MPILEVLIQIELMEKLVSSSDKSCPLEKGGSRWTSPLGDPHFIDYTEGISLIGVLTLDILM